MEHPRRVRRVGVVPLSALALALGGCAAARAPAAPVPDVVTAARIDWLLPSSAPVPPSSLDESAARSLQRAIDAAPAWPAGVYNCPMDDGSRARITFLRSGRAVETVTARLTGCAGIAGRTMPDAAATILRDAGPPGLRIFGGP